MTGRHLLKGPCLNGLYPIRSSSSKQPFALISTQAVPHLWHKRLGHPAATTLKNLSKYISSYVTLLITLNVICADWPKAIGYHLINLRILLVLVLKIVHADVWGTSPTFSTNGFKFYVLFIVDFSKYCWVYPITHKSEVVYKFIEFCKMINRQFNTNIKMLRSDGGGEFINHHFQLFRKQQGIIHQYTCPYTPSQNGVAERKHRHIIEMFVVSFSKPIFLNIFGMTLFTHSYTSSIGFRLLCTIIVHSICFISSNLPTII
ncbi:hypothetical protein KFK09_010835 [Dendrobium nobile]|uniref:Integrase catalytic domain-containing protein n=1 Tax=Dendrobium nobile TaxID=94219 RepID=A0A8T3BCV5_DENNO|nr:hypothetical protein KFK09_010835 [Dendrobium nobile]